jgi:hypothetical protein
MCPLLFVEAAFRNDDETHFPVLYCPHYPIPSQQGQRLLPTPLNMSTLIAEAAFGMIMKRIVLSCTVPTTPFPANRDRDYYLPP